MKISNCPSKATSLRFALAILLSFVVHVAYAPNSKKKKDFNTKMYLGMCKGRQKLQGTHRDHATLKWLLQTSGELSVTSTDSHQNRAACWMLYDDKRKPKPASKSMTQRYALAVLFSATKGGTRWIDKTDWLSQKNECSWYGISCDAMSTITDIDLGFNDLEGMLPRELGLLNPIEVDMHGNDLEGVVPYSVFRNWKSTRVLRLQMNGFFGAIPSEISHMTSLRELTIFGNYFGGKVPKEMAALKDLEHLDIYANTFTGSIPSELAQLKHLQDFDTHDNDFVGRVPSELCKRRMKSLISDCLGYRPEVICECCTICCAGMPDMMCVDTETKEEVIVGQTASIPKKNKATLAV
uniref:Leucine-rich repeat-containing N-terminal plant-type domain-containing protein n=1 Tax=Grammatophora oceanica TaxID=210454 RepID=A0A7S1UPJ3_9STRA|mmetsp:Transcript_13389/g.19704  ORF Transcript_13389/g.19704 Transcript_13389/m.19704 type:complete len:352 (+) Transcript_13389:172-1227(+)|eukprot:CAMPEP_0194054694 /NCGR_PEP_ID=MMETSP0009_2-20130614/54243_1 /TAXON_ID=210454 /ORGANISM="Grammatophora oceanica, Strain CCMP 410" /LENGTH=351 /DNA_ID=CAMNT_0038703287 /DNA_START=137 /DNA_END=1192 /DNA_ORIENTATION=-